ncbi:energy transducer TonB [Fibrella sp. HMF5335]|uniref:Energy transducer TonB n=1 Tax=Fibrella rubiginis TaxID=2817060 RepID=A0A939K758_9BACT|nr:energy transducer TonB [Fibrella rubiginis]MBO0938275.1 energy transducer TonB [Fibrella rubiginis]
MANFDDLIFEHRNQAYGAYDLRKAYRATLGRAVVLGSLLFVGALQIPSLYALVKPERTAFMDEITLTNVTTEAPPEDKVVIPPKEEIAPTVATVKNLVPEVVADAPDDVPPIATVDELKEAISGQTTQEGTGDMEIIAPPESSAPTAIEQAIEKPEVNDDAPFTVVEQQPEFPGGISALAAYLQRNLHYPGAASSAGVSGKVYLNFIVNTDGSLVDVEVIKGIGFGCDDEALRVVKNMPRWKAGRQAGRTVRVKFTLPVVFRLD